MAYLPGPMDTFQGEEVLYATGYTVDSSVIKQHMAIGFMLSLTLVGMIYGIPLILRGYYLSRNSQKAIIITKKSLYELERKDVIWSVPLGHIDNILWRSSLMGLMEIKIVDHFGKDRIIKGNFYENEFHIILSTLRNHKDTM